MLSGDIEWNPGPSPNNEVSQHEINICHINIRSIKHASVKELNVKLELLREEIRWSE